MGKFEKSKSSENVKVAMRERPDSEMERVRVAVTQSVRQFLQVLVAG